MDTTGSHVQVLNAFGQGLDAAAHNALGLAQAQLGAEAERFLSSPTGRLLVGRAEEAIVEFLTWALGDDAKAQEFEERRAKALAARTFVIWMAETINEGQTAASETQK